MKMVLRQFFLNFSNANIQFAEKKLTWSSYIAKEALVTIQRVELIDEKKFAKAMLNENIKTFMLYVSSLSLESKISSYPA